METAEFITPLLAINVGKNENSTFQAMNFAFRRRSMIFISLNIYVDRK